MSIHDPHQPSDGAGPRAPEAARGLNRRLFARALVQFVPTVNAVLLVVQAVLVQPPYDTLLPAWIYLVVNAAVVLCAALVRIVVIVTSNPVVRAWIGLANSTENELG